MMFKSFCGTAFLTFLTACSQPQLRSPEELVNALMNVWASGDSDQLIQLMSPDVVYDDIPNGASLKGIDASINYVTHVHEWASDVEIVVDRCFGNDDKAVAEWTMTATQSGPIPGRVPVATNKRITLRGATIVHVEGGRITRAADYLDALAFVLQLGSEVALPGDVVLRLPE